MLFKEPQFETAVGEWLSDRATYADAERFHRVLASPLFEGTEGKEVKRPSTAERSVGADGSGSARVTIKPNAAGRSHH